MTWTKGCDRGSRLSFFAKREMPGIRRITRGGTQRTLSPARRARLAGLKACASATGFTGFVVRRRSVAYPERYRDAEEEAHVSVLQADHKAGAVPQAVSPGGRS